MYEHTVYVSYRHDPVIGRPEEAPSSTNVEITGSSDDLRTAWSGILDRMPADVLDALTEAMKTRDT